MIKYVSLFSGVGGFEQALDKFDSQCVLASEIDKYANQAYEVLYGHPTVGDVTKVHERDIPDHELLCAGFPCQAFSIAGNRKGFDDVRGTLFFEVARIAKEKQPRVVLLENVKGLISHDKGKTLQVILETMTEIGYTLDFAVLNSKYFNLAQNRERVFIVAVRNDLVEQENWVIQKKDHIGKAKIRLQELGSIQTFNFSFPVQKEVTRTLREFLEESVDDKYYLSDDKTAQLVTALHEKGVAVREATKTGYALAEEGDAVNIAFPSSETRRGRVGKQCAQTLEASNINQGVVVTEPQLEQVGMLNMKGAETTRHVYSPDGLSPTLTTMGGGHREPKIAEVRPVLTPERMEKRQNGRRFKEDGEEAFTLTAQDRHGVAIGVPPVYRIRKLTPRECFRLQGFPDSEFDKLEKAGISNTQLYKMAGNAVSVNVITALIEKIQKYL